MLALVTCPFVHSTNDYCSLSTRQTLGVWGHAEAKASRCPHTLSSLTEEADPCVWVRAQMHTLAPVQLALTALKINQTR